MKDIPMEAEDEGSLVTIPATISTLSDYELERFIKIEDHHTDPETTKADLAILNNHLAMCEAVLPHVRTVSGLCALNTSVIRLLESRRKVKKLDYGKTSDDSKRRVFEIVE